MITGTPAVVANGAVGVTVSSVVVDVISLVVISSILKKCKNLPKLLFQFSVYVASISPSQRDPSTVVLLQDASYSLKGVFKFFLSWFEGLRTEGVTTVQIVLLLTWVR